VSLWNASLIVLWILVLFNLMLTYALIRRVGADRKPTAAEGLSAGTTAPGFEAATPDGQTLSHPGLDDRAPLVLAFFSPTCSACEHQIPAFVKFSDRAKASGVRTIAVLDGGLDESTALRAALPNGTTTLLAPRDSNPLLDDYRIEAFPSYTVIHADGTIEGTYGAVEQLGSRLKALSGKALSLK
jgi:peroxiredoxin